MKSIIWPVYAIMSSSGLLQETLSIHDPMSTPYPK